MRFTKTRLVQFIWQAEWSLQSRAGKLLYKVKRLSKRLGFDVNLHGLRRTFVTIAANAGKPINIISLALGHADLKTTQWYLMTTQDEVIKEMQNW